mmetsp:Transcript_8640/g.12391  ORF Transcript_8640/g.12391 Transcript_8640/m.12391 type:complete len:88 (-) Transcript_8640:1580-1843(-)
MLLLGGLVRYDEVPLRMPSGTIDMSSYWLMCSGTPLDFANGNVVVLNHGYILRRRRHLSSIIYSSNQFALKNKFQTTSSTLLNSYSE